MTVIISQDPKSKLWFVFSSELDCFVAKNLTEDQIVQWYAIAGAQMAKDILVELKAGKNPFGENYLSYQDCVAIQKEFNPESECPVVNRIHKKAS